MINFICFLCQLYKEKINYIYVEINYFFVIYQQNKIPVVYINHLATYLKVE